MKTNLNVFYIILFFPVDEKFSGAFQWTFKKRYLYFSSISEKKNRDLVYQ